jgi:two-component system chemotaxis sensor kinase CheA
MSFAEDDDILQDFLVEAGEILEKLSEQLVDLEQFPDDRDLLNAIFRGFHTVKGGAGFLQLEAMVECCHITENLFDILRNGKRTVTPELMDVVLQALDAVNEQFRQISRQQEAVPASPELIAQLERLVSCEDIEDAPVASDSEPQADAADDTTSAANSPDTNESSSAELDITDDEFEGFLNAISDKPETGDNAVAVGNTEQGASSAPLTHDDITDDEFENLLDELHGKGKGPGSDKPAKTASVAAEASSADKTAGTSGSTPAGDEISEDEFEALLDQLHGAGKGPGAKDTKVTQAPPSKPSESAAEANKKAVSKDDITDDEFEALLDQLHGKGKGPSLPSSDAKQESPAEMATSDGADKASGHNKPKSTQGQKVDKKAEPAPAVQSSVRASLSAKAGAGRPEPTPSKSPAPAVAAPAAETTVRVDTQRLDDIMNMVGELVLVRNRLVRLGSETTDEVLSKAVANLDVVTADLQTAVMKTRMQPIKKVFGRFPRVVRDLARNLKKEINLELQGEETDLDKNLVEALADPLVHLVRNAVDHGIEMPAEREAKGKSKVGKVVLSAEQEGDHILLAISDDGGGMDPNALRAKAIEKGILDPDSAGRIGDIEAFNLIFAPGFSTKTEISDVSGRGVGMDVVKTKITQLNGSITISSKLGEGTRIAIKVPLTLAIMPTLMVMLENQTFALPLVSVNEIFHLNLTTTNVVDGQECVTVRDKAIPIFHLKRWLIKRPANNRPTEGHVVIVTIGTQRVGFVVDQLIGQEEVVIKPLGKMLHGTPGMAGATITGDGTIALILDVPGLLKRYANRV